MPLYVLLIAATATERKATHSKFSTYVAQRQTQMISKSSPNAGRSDGSVYLDVLTTLRKGLPSQVGFSWC